MRLKGGKVLLPIKFSSISDSKTIHLSNEEFNAILEKGCEILLDFTSVDGGKFIHPLIVESYSAEENLIDFKTTKYITANGDVYIINISIAITSNELYFLLVEEH